MLEFWKVLPVGEAEAECCLASTLWPAVEQCGLRPSTVGLCECSDTAMHLLLAALLSQIINLFQGKWFGLYQTG